MNLNAKDAAWGKAVYEGQEAPALGTAEKDANTRIPEAPTAIRQQVSGLLTDQGFPVFRSPACMRNDDGAANDIGHCKDLVQLGCGNTLLIAFAQVVFDAVVAAQHHAGHEAQHLLGLRAQRPFFISVGVEVPEPFHHQVVLAEDHFIHSRAIVIELLNQVVHVFRFKRQS